jgi:hypothetical protein
MLLGGAPGFGIAAIEKCPQMPDGIARSDWMQPMMNAGGAQGNDCGIIALHCAFVDGRHQVVIRENHGR